MKVAKRLYQKIKKSANNGSLPITTNNYAEEAICFEGIPHINQILSLRLYHNLPNIVSRYSFQSSKN